ncbi:serine/arginine repetitive matrix protein 2-like isoform X2 [Colletes gigas]|uniref:serine/arginine repetitive matrix protein 2-like isoform X2 n=1 Tax=Colletes gigas TaxID=935657 RepID=UPI001C9B71F1|nr:serine/arginine repetitive matrix protein 2-like isoform X2 [Colletes gigas]XP_043254898.1 serine/arginine repetitive matrix protein 2-like isoform X2 [Colletes gigas]
MAAPQASSRLELLQARFQQKQLQEKEQKLLQLYDQQQQRAYQVVQRGSAGSNNSNHGSSVSHTVTRTSTSSHSTSTSQGGKVRQMFDERRQTTVKGIDRSYPLEPLENKPRKQTNGNAVQKNGNLTVNRHSVTVKRVARADVNSNLNGGKPVVSYHEEITRESFGPSGQQHPDDDEFGNENHVAQYANGNHRDETHIEEVLNDDTIERNRMMAKLHLMQYDETLKHRVKNDLESEEFPEDFMVDVPDKLPKQSVTKKLSQAEARLERFRNANAKRNNSIAKNTNTIGAPKKRFDPIYPVKSTPSNRGNDGRTRIGENRRRKGFAIENVEETVSSSESEKTRMSESPKFFCRESEKSATTYAIDSRAVGKSSKDVKRNVVKIGPKRNEDWFSEPNENETERSVIVGIDTVDRDIKSPGPGRISGSSSPDSLKHDTMSCKNIESKSRLKSVSVFERLTRDRGASPRYESGTVNLKSAFKSPDPPEKIVRKRSNSPIVLRKHDRRSVRTAAPKSPVFRKSSPRFFSSDADRSATIMLVTPETITKMKTRSPTPASKDGQRSFGNRSDLAVKDRITWPSRRSSKENIDESSRFNIRSSVSRFFAEQCEKASRNIDAENSIRSLQTDRCSDMSRSSSPVSLKDVNIVTPGNRNLSFLNIENGKPTRTMKVGEKPGTTVSFKPRSSIDKSDLRPKSPRSGSRSKSPEFFCYETEKSGTTVSLKPKSTMSSMDERSKSPRSRPSSSTDVHLKGRSSKSSPDTFSIPKDVEVTGSISRKNSRESSPRLQKIVDIRSKSPEFFCYETEKSGTTVSLKPGSSIDITEERSKSPRSRPSSSSSVPPKGRSLKSSDMLSIPKDVEVTGSMSRRNSRELDSRSRSPEFFCYETEKSGTTVSLKPRSSIDKTDERSKNSGSRPSSSTSVHSRGRSSKNPDIFITPKDVEVTKSMSRKDSRESSPRLQKIVDIRRKSPEFFCYETEKSGTTVSLKPRSSIDKTDERSKSPRSRPSSSPSVPPKGRSSKSPDIFSIPKDIKVTGSMSRRNSDESSPKLHKIVDIRSKSPEFFCYESEKSGTTVSLKPRSSIDKTDERSKSPRSRPSSSPSVPPKGRSSKSPDMFSIPKDIKVTGTMSRRNSRELDSRSRSPEFFCYETEKSGTTISFKPKSTMNSMDERTKSPRSRPSSSPSVPSKGRSSKSPEIFSIPKDIKVTGSMSRRNSGESSPKLHKIVDIRSKSPEFFCYETEKSGTTVSLKPRSSIDKTERSKSPRSRPSSSPSFHPKGRSSKSPDMLSIPKDIKVTGTMSRRNSSELDARSKSPEFFCYETVKSGTTMSFKPKSTMNSMDERSKSPRSRPSSSPSVHPKGRSSKIPDIFSIPKDIKVTGSMSRRNSDESSPKLHKIVDIRSKSPEFFCYETEKSGTTVTLKPRSSIDKTERSKSPRSRPTSSPSVPSKARSSKSPDMLNIPKDIKVTGTMSRRNSSELDARSKSPESFCYETEKSATTISFKPKSTKDSMYKRFNSPRPGSTGVQSGRSSKSPDVFSAPKDTKVASRRGSGNVLRSTKLIRDIIKHQKHKDHGDRTLGKDTKTSRRSSVAFEDTTEGRHHAMEVETVELGANRNLEYETLAPESSPKSSLSVEVDAEIQEITMPDQYVERGKLQQEQLRTYSRSSDKTTQNFAETKAENASTYSVRKPGKKRGSLFESNIFEPSKKHQQTTEHRRVSKSSTTVNSKRLEQNTTRNERSSPSPTSESGFRGRKRQEKTSQKRAQALGSIELVRRIMRETHSEQEDARNIVGEFIKYDGDSDRNYERTDSVESALRRFDSIGKELGAASAQSTLERGKESVAEKRQTLDESSGIEGSAGGSRTISLKALDRTNVNFPRSPETSRTSLKRIPMTIETQEGGQKKLARARDSIEIAEIVVRSKSPACRRRLFRGEDLGEGTGNGSSRSTKTAERVSKPGKRDAIDSVKVTSKFVKTAAGDGTSMKKSDERKEEASTGEFTSVKQLRSIEDIRKSIENESPGRKARESWSRSAIANDVSKWSSAGETRRENGVRVGNRKEASLPKRSENLSAGNCLRDWDRSFSRVAKSPSPDSSRATETPGNRTRRNVPPSPSKSPDTVSRRPSTDSKAQDTKSTKRPAPMKGTEPIGNRKTTTTTTRKSTDVVDGPVLENGLHLRDQTAETKYDNDSPTTKKSNAFVIDFDEQPPKENDGSLPRKPRLRKQSMEKQTPSTQSGRPPSSVSSTSSGSTMQSHVSSPKSRMASKVHAPASATTASKRSASTRGGGNMCATDLLVPCKICGRRFAQDRVTLHEQICAKTGQKKRKQFDTVMFRVKGTELEKFVRKGHCKKQPEKPPEVKSNWRRKHEDFINAIRSAKQVQAHLAAGGKLSDLPPPPASDTSDYIQCPHCGRKFNKAAAERHIPKCEHMLHNKPVHSRAPKPKR